ncbi:MAG: MFS transporter [Oscillospiraceae bacterium]|nr:MFS transporter [Oscillospiraceae bacterium]
MDLRFRRVKRGCYIFGVTMAILINLSPVLFLTLRERYGISYTALAALVSVNFVTQLLVDLLFSFRPQYFDIPRVVRYAPLLAAAGLALYGLWPLFFPGSAYWGLLAGTVIFSASGGLAEVLLSPVIAAIPSADPDRQMSALHSAYAWGVGPVVLLSTAYLHLFGREHWHFLPLLFTAVPLTAFGLLAGAEFPDMARGAESAEKTPLKSRTLWLCVAAIFLGGAAENTMSQWGSSYLEGALGIPKVVGDALGVALFSLMLGTGRTLYTKFGSGVERFLYWGSIGAAGCYLTAALCPVPAVGLMACALLGLCTSLLWPGTLIVAAERIPTGGVVMYALLAAGGDLGSSVIPQLIGLITDASIGRLPGGEQTGMRLGMLLGALCPILAAFIFRKFRKNLQNS